MHTNEQFSFEGALEKLSETVKTLEGGELTLEQSLKEFEEGVRLVKLCQQKLTAAEQKVELLIKATETEGIKKEPFSPGKT